MYEWSKKYQVLRLIAIEIILMVLMGFFTAYGPEAVPSASRSSVKGDQVSTTAKSNILQKDTSVYASKFHMAYIHPDSFFFFEGNK